jgi:hypothetical protein
MLGDWWTIWRRKILGVSSCDFGLWRAVGILLGCSLGINRISLSRHASSARGFLSHAHFSPGRLG